MVYQNGSRSLYGLDLLDPELIGKDLKDLSVIRSLNILPENADSWEINDVTWVNTNFHG